MINKTLAQMNAERAAGPARHNLKLKRKNKKNKSASFLSQCGISYDHKAKNFKMKKQKATSPQAGGPAQ